MEAKARQAPDAHTRAFYRDAAAHWRFLADAEEAAAALNLAPVTPSQVLSISLGALVQAAIQRVESNARAAFYISDGATLHHVVGMPEAYARLVDGFVIGPQSLACGLAASRREAIITRDVAEEPLW